MTSKNTGKVQLGRGMAALLASNSMGLATDQITTEKVSNSDKKEFGYVLVGIDQIVPNKDQPRKIFKEEELQELSSSIKESGLIQPITVHSTGGKYEIIAGERRWRASKMAGLKEIPVVIKNVTSKERLVISIIENVQRSDLNCVEEALAYYQLMSEFNLTQEEVAKRVGKDRSTIANFLRILKLPREIVGMLQKNEITFGHAKILVGIKDENAAKKFAESVKNDAISVRELEKIVTDYTNRASSSEQLQPENDQADLKNESKRLLENKINKLVNSLEADTGLHIKCKISPRYKGKFEIYFENRDDFDSVLEYLSKVKK